MYVSDKELNAMEKAFSGTLGSEILSKDIKLVRGHIDPNKRYTEGYYDWYGTNCLADAIIEYQDGTRHTLMKKRH